METLGFLLAPWGLLHGNKRGYNPKLNTNLYSVPRIIVLKKDRLTRIKSYHTESLCLQITHHVHCNTKKC